MFGACVLFMFEFAVGFDCLLTISYVWVWLVLCLYVSGIVWCV